MPYNKQHKTWLANPMTFERHWWVVDLEGKTLGRAATQIARVLTGKHRPTYTPHVDAGDFVVVVNADKVHLTGKKWEIKNYYDHTLFPGGLITRTAGTMKKDKPEELIKRAIWGMLPKGPLGRRQYKKLKVYTSKTHPHTAQNPKPLAV